MDSSNGPQGHGIQYKVQRTDQLAKYGSTDKVAQVQGGRVEGQVECSQQGEQCAHVKQ